MIPLPILHRLAKETRKLHSLQHKAKFQDMVLFRTDKEHFIKISTVHKLKEYITMNKDDVFRSINQVHPANLQMILVTIEIRWDNMGCLLKEKERWMAKILPSKQPRPMGLLSL